jgi:hypothetical protein
MSALSLNSALTFNVKVVLLARQIFPANFNTNAAIIAASNVCLNFIRQSEHQTRENRGL